MASRVERGWGPLAIERELRQRGLAGALVDAALEAFVDQWRERMDAARAKRFGGAPTDPRERLRQARFLEYRGFPRDLIRAWLHRA